MQLCLEGWDQALFPPPPHYSLEVSSPFSEESRGETSSIPAGGLQPIERCPSSFAHAVVSWGTVGSHLFADIFMPELSPSLLSCSWSTKAQQQSCVDPLWARQCSSISWPCGQCWGWGMRCSDYSSSARFQLITQGEKARLWALQKMETDPLASWGLVFFSPVEHLSVCNINPSPAPSSPLCTVEPFHPWVIPAKLAYTVGETPFWCLNRGVTS